MVARRQLAALGLAPGAVESRLERERLHRIHQGVYAVGHRAISREGAWMAAVLALGRGAALSHGSTAALWGLRPTTRGEVDVTVARNVRRRRGIHVHRMPRPPTSGR